MIDSHCHLNDQAFSINLEKVISDAFGNDVNTILVPGWNVTSSIDAIKIASIHKGIYAAVGIHPENLDGDIKQNLLEIANLAESKKVIAIGEVGLDYHYGKDNAMLQKEYLVGQLELAKKLNLPVIIHMRDATEDFLELIKTYISKSGKRPNIGIMHSYSGSVETMKTLLDLGFYISFSGPVTYKNARSQKECALVCPLDKILVETDSPYLPPVPHRGEINEPKNVGYVIDEIASIKRITKEELVEATTRNFNNLFNL